MVHEGGWPDEQCGQRQILQGSGMDKDGCAQKARTKGLKSFGWGASSNTRGMCFGIALDVTAEYWTQAKNDRTDIKCPNGAWEDSGLFDTYIMNPTTV